MKELTEYEWAVLGEIAKSLLRNREEVEVPNGKYWVATDTLVEHEVELLKKIAE